MFSCRRALLAAATSLSLIGWAGSSHAATCPDPTIVGTGWLVVTTAPVSTCIGVGKGDVSVPGYTLLDKSDDIISGVFFATSPLAPGDFVASSGSDTFTIGATPGYDSLVLVIKDGNLGDLPSPPFADNQLQWGAFLLGALTGSWEIRNADGTLRAALSHASLYGQLCEGLCGPPTGAPPEVPIPGAFLLMGTVLAGGGGFAAWRRRRERASS